VVTPPASVVLQGVPAIPAAYAEAMNRYADYRTAHLVAWHTVRREMLIATRFGNTFQLHRVTSPGGERTQVTFDEAGVAGTGLGARRNGMLPTPLVWTTIVIGASLLTPLGFFGFFLVPLWLIVVGLILNRSASQPSEQIA